MNYTELFNAVQAYTENVFPDTYLADGNVYSASQQIDTFIRQAEKRIYNTVQLPVQRKNVLGSVTAGNTYLTLPSDWLSAYSVAITDAPSGGYAYLLNKDVNFIREAFPYPAVSGTPKYYAIFDQNTFILGPTPDDDYGVEMHYYAYPPSIVDAGTSWLGDNYDPALLYGTLLEAYIFMKGEQDVLAMYQQKYDEAMGQLKRLADGLDRQDAYRSGQVRVGVR